MSNFVRYFIFASGPTSASAVDWLLLALRIVFGGLLLIHGVQKILSYDSLATTFPDPIGLGSRLSLQLAIFAEALCSLAVISGLFFRLAIIPILVTMCVAAFFALKGAPWVQRELPVSYLIVFVILWIAGPGRFSIDSVIVNLGKA